METRLTVDATGNHFPSNVVSPPYFCTFALFRLFLERNLNAFERLEDFLVRALALPDYTKVCGCFLRPSFDEQPPGRLCCVSKSNMPLLSCRSAYLWNPIQTRDDNCCCHIKQIEQYPPTSVVLDRVRAEHQKIHDQAADLFKRMHQLWKAMLAKSFYWTCIEN